MQAGGTVWGPEEVSETKEQHTERCSLGPKGWKVSVFSICHTPEALLSPGGAGWEMPHLSLTGSTQLGCCCAVPCFLEQGKSKAGWLIITAPTCPQECPAQLRGYQGCLWATCKKHYYRVIHPPLDSRVDCYRAFISDLQTAQDSKISFLSLECPDLHNLMVYPTRFHVIDSWSYPVISLSYNVTCTLSHPSEKPAL